MQVPRLYHHLPQEEKPRARVVFLLDQPIMQAKNYTLAASALLWVFGTADRLAVTVAASSTAAPGAMWNSWTMFFRWKQ